MGSGALSMAMLRAGAHITGYELRADFAQVARANVAAFLGPDQHYEVLERDIYLGIDTEGLDRVVLDLPEPWQVVEHAARALAGWRLFLLSTGQMWGWRDGQEWMVSHHLLAPR